MGCSGGGSQNTTTSTQQANPAAQQAFIGALNQAGNVASQPLQQYGGPLVSGFTPDQLQAMGTIRGVQGVVQPYINDASQLMQSAAQPIQPMTFNSDAVNSLMSPYLGAVAGNTANLFNQQNAQQQAAIQGNATSRGAYGGDREAVAQALAAQQEQMAQAPVLANIYNSGYGQALGQFNALNQAQIGAQEATGWLQQGAGYGLANLGNQAQSSALTGANSLLQSGAMQQQLAQNNLNIPYEMFQQQQGFPYQSTGWLGNLAEGLGSGLGGSSSTTTPGPSLFGQLAGAGTAAAGVGGLGNSLGWWGSSTPSAAASDAAIQANLSGLGNAAIGGINGFGVNRGGRIGYATGGSPTADLGIMGGLDDVPDVAVSFIPNVPPAALSAAGKLSGNTGNTTTTSSNSGGGGGGLGEAAGAIGTVAKIAGFFLNHGGRVGLAAGGTTDPSTGLPVTHPFVPPTVGNASVAPIIHSMPTLEDLPKISPASHAAASMGDIQPVVNFAPTFDANLYPSGMTPLAPGTANPPPISLPTVNGVIVRPGQASAAASAPSAAAAPAPDPLAGILQVTQEDGGGGARGGRVGYDLGGTITNLPQVPDLSISYIGKAPTTTTRGGVGIPPPPRGTADTSTQDSKAMTDAMSGLGKAFGSKTTTTGSTPVETDSAGGAVFIDDSRQGYDLGGMVDPGQASMGQAYGGLNPMQSGMLSQYTNLPMEKLQELAARAGNGTPQGQAIQRALTLKKMNPYASPAQNDQQQAQQPQQAALGTPATSALSPGIAGLGTMYRGGRAHYEDGGDVSDATKRILLDRMAADNPSASNDTLAPSTPTPAPQTMTGDMDAPSATVATFPKELTPAQTASTPVGDLGGGAPTALNPAPVPSLGALPDPATLTRRAKQPAQGPSAGTVGSGYDAPNTATGRALAGRTNVENFWVGQGAPLHVAQGIADSVGRETGGTYSGGAWNPDDKGSPSGGLYQHHAQRLDNLKQSAADWGVDWRDPNFQNGFANWERKGGDPTTAVHWQEIISAPDRATAQTLWDKYFERGVVNGPGHNVDLASGAGGIKASATGATGAAGPVDLGSKPSAAAQKLQDLLAKFENMPEPEQRHTIANNPWLGLIAAGLGMMASRNPHALGAIGEGGLAGVKVLESQEAEAVKAETARNESQHRNALLQVSLAAHAQTADYQAQELLQHAQQLQQSGQVQAATIAHDKALDAHADAVAAEAKRHNIAEEGTMVAQSGYGADPNNPDGPQVWGTYYNPKIPDPTKPDGGRLFTPGGASKQLAGTAGILQNWVRQGLATDEVDAARKLAAAKTNPDSFKRSAEFARLVQSSVSTHEATWRASNIDPNKPVPNFRPQAEQEVMSSLNHAPGATPAATPASAPATAAPSLPAAAAQQLKEGMVTTFTNGQKWTLQGGSPVQVP